MDFGLKDLFRVEAPPYMGQGNPELLLQGGPVRNQVGKGRAVYFPEVKPAIEKPPAEPMRSQYWKLPLNWEELATAIRWTAGGMLSLEVKAPATLNVVAEVTKQKEKDKLLLHLVNYGVAKTPEVKGIEVEVEMPAGKKANRVTVLTPDRATEAALSYSAAPDRIRFTVPALETYNLVVIQLS
jgi:hypothetical protein